MEDEMKRTNNLLAKVAEEPGAISTMSLADRKEVARLMTEETSALGKMINDSERALIARLEAQGDRFIPIEEVADRLGRPMKAVLRSWKAGMYPFIIGDGNGIISDGSGKLVASEGELRRWMKESARHEANFFWVDENEVTICAENKNEQAEVYLQIIQERGDEQVTEIILNPKKVKELRFFLGADPDLPVRPARRKHARNLKQRV
jgi:hypothetical protein